MPLLELWKASRSEYETKQLHQLISIAGSTGKLGDGNDTCGEFRDFLKHVSSDLLARYVDECLTQKFESSGFALQDIVNEIGRRLGFQVQDGRYRGAAGQIGHDGLWRSENGHSLVVEVKTTDTFRIDLNTLARYRRQLIQASQASGDQSSILVIVGRQDTGDLEAQIRGSRHAWDVRLVSVDALIGLMRVKESVEDPEILQKISEILIPQEFTRLDGIVDLVFSATEDVQEEREAEERPTEEPRPERKFIPVRFNDACAERVRSHLDQVLVKQSRGTYVSPEGDLAVLCLASKTHEAGAGNLYWFAFHRHQRQRLSARDNAFVALGCGSAEKLLLVPFADFEPWLERMNVTEREDRYYWHVHVREQDSGRSYTLRTKRDHEAVDLSGYLI